MPHIVNISGLLFVKHGSIFFTCGRHKIISCSSIYKEKTKTYDHWAIYLVSRQIGSDLIERLSILLHELLQRATYTWLHTRKKVFDENKGNGHTKNETS